MRSRISIQKVASPRRWTQTAADCYKRGCRCSGCFYDEFFKGSSQKCQMKKTVLDLVRVLGRPELTFKGQSNCANGDK